MDHKDTANLPRNESKGDDDITLESIEYIGVIDRD
jgi:hypothetical protein